MTIDERIPKAILVGHTSAETAHISYEYPFGFRLKCLQQNWIESPRIGAGKGRGRRTHRTTQKTFNVAYSERLMIDTVAANAWANEQIKAGTVQWNKPKSGTYHDLCVLTLTDLPDESGRLGIGIETINAYAGPDQFDRFQKYVATSIGDSERAALAMLERIDRRMNPTSWAEHDARITG